MGIYDRNKANIFQSKEQVNVAEGRCGALQILRLLTTGTLFIDAMLQ